MSKRLNTRLSEEDRLALAQVVRKSPDWRARERAKTLLLLCQPMLSREVAKVQDPQHLHRARDLAALAQGRHGMPVRQAS